MAQIGCLGVSFKRRRDPSALSKIRPKGRSVGKKSLKGLEEAIFRARNAALRFCLRFFWDLARQIGVKMFSKKLIIYFAQL